MLHAEARTIENVHDTNVGNSLSLFHSLFTVSGSLLSEVGNGILYQAVLKFSRESNDVDFDAKRMRQWFSVSVECWESRVEMLTWHGGYMRLLVSCPSFRQALVIIFVIRDNFEDPSDFSLFHFAISCRFLIH